MALLTQSISDYLKIPAEQPAELEHNSQKHQQTLDSQIEGSSVLTKGSCSSINFNCTDQHSSVLARIRKRNPLVKSFQEPATPYRLSRLGNRSMDAISVLDSNYEAKSSIASTIQPNDSVSGVSQPSGRSLLSRKKLEEPTIPGSIISRSSRAKSMIYSQTKSAKSHRALSPPKSEVIKPRSKSMVSNRTVQSSAKSEGFISFVRNLENQIRKKLSGGSVYSLRALFKINSTDLLTTQTGILSPVVMLSGLNKTLCSFLNVNSISDKQLKTLLNKLHIPHDKPIHFEIFYSRIRDGNPVGEYTKWFDPAQRKKELHQDWESAMERLKKISRNDLAKVLPSLEGDAVTTSDLLFFI